MSIVLNFVTPQLAISGRAYDWSLKAHGITHVVNARIRPDKVKGVITLHNPTEDDKQPKGKDYWARTVTFALQCLEDPNTKLLVHCKAGVNRSAGHAYAILRALGYGAEEAWEMLKKARPQVKPRYVEDVENSLFRKSM